MKYLKTIWVALAVLAITVLPSCNKDESPITLDSMVTISNTFQSDAFTDGVELPIETLFMVDANSLEATATVAEATEFSAYLLGLYDVDIDETSISFEVVAQEGDETYGDLFRTLEAGTTDRYYLTFTEDQNVTGFSSSNSSVNLRIDSDKVLVVEIGEGFDFNPGSSFTITLSNEE